MRPRAPPPTWRNGGSNKGSTRMAPSTVSSEHLFIPRDPYVIRNWITGLWKYDMEMFLLEIDSIYVSSLCGWYSTAASKMMQLKKLTILENARFVEIKGRFIFRLTTPKSYFSSHIICETNVLLKAVNTNGDVPSTEGLWTTTKKIYRRSWSTSLRMPDRRVVPRTCWPTRGKFR